MDSKKVIKISLPIRMSLKDKKIGGKQPKNYFLNLNVYRNLNMHVNNNLKKRFKENMISILEEMNIERDLYLKQITVDYEIFFPDKRARDLMNIGSIIDKFALDTIVDYGIIDDDNHNFIKLQSFKFGGYDDKKEGYAVMTITEI